MASYNKVNEAEDTKKLQKYEKFKIQKVSSTIQCKQMKVCARLQHKCQTCIYS